jgi:phosphomethylpyrimidine synthase
LIQIGKEYFMTQLELARKGEITPQMRQVAAAENLPAEIIRDGVASGRIVIPWNINHQPTEARGVGEGLRIKVNANIGTSTAFPDMEPELEKLKIALAAGADAVMDLSTGGEIDAVRAAVLQNCPVPVGTVPIYQVATYAVKDSYLVSNLSAEDMLAGIEKHCKDGADFITIHCGVTKSTIDRLRQQGRVADVVSRGGSFLSCWILMNEKENPLYEHYDDILEMARKYDVTLSLGDGYRPGCLADATDRAQIQELIILGELVDRARKAGVQAMVEGPGHVPLNQVAANIQLQKQLCDNAPFYVLGPLVTDVAPGYDHITSAIGGAVAGMAGADFLCYVTPAEHLGLPSPEDVHEGVIASRIAAHAGDIAKGTPGAMDWDLEMSKARKGLDWKKQIELSIDPIKSDRYRKRLSDTSGDVCSMCGEFCAMKVMDHYLKK